MQTEHAARLAVAELRAWCPNCYSKARARGQAQRQIFEQREPDTLF